jgi:hypothetical protein
MAEVNHAHCEMNNGHGKSRPLRKQADHGIHYRAKKTDHGIHDQETENIRTMEFMIKGKTDHGIHDQGTERTDHRIHDQGTN